MLDPAKRRHVLTDRITAKALSGFSLIELMVVVTIMALMVIMFAPDMATWIANSKVRGAAESLASELRLAQLEALRRNRQAVFALTDDTPALDAAPKDNALNWFVRAVPTPDEGADPGFQTTGLFVHGSQQARLAQVSITGPGLLCFNAMGRPVSPAVSPVGKVSTCAVPGDAVTPVSYTIERSGADRRLDVEVALGGMIRLCDPDKSRADGEADACK
jgi:type IV fimbrial biogenesis protein FimT